MYIKESCSYTTLIMVIPFNNLSKKMSTLSRNQFGKTVLAMFCSSNVCKC